MVKSKTRLLWVQQVATIILENTTSALLNPKGNTMYENDSNLVEKVVFNMSSSIIFTWWYLDNPLVNE